MRPIKLILVHVSATPPDMDIGAAEIKHLHTMPNTEIIKWGKVNVRGKGWSDIGYHAILRRNGQVENGRPIERAGAHARGYNAYSLGYVLIGGVDDDGKPDFNFTRHQMDSLYRLLNVTEYEYPDAAILGHRDLPGVAKACPCFNVRAWYGIPE